MQTSIKISAQEFEERRIKLFNHLQVEGLSGVVLFDSTYILYYTGFAFIPTERPVAFVMNASGETVMFVPRLELEHARANADVDQVEHYLEYPYHVHPMEILKGTLEKLNFSGRIGVDTDGYPWILGYRGPSISEVTESQVTRVSEFIEDQMMIKSRVELALIRESVKWGHLAHTLLQRYTRAGLTETEVSQAASAEANQAMLDAIGPIYRAQSPFARGASAGYRGQIGRNAAIPHAMANNIAFQEGDVLVTGAGAPVWGYHSELERTMIVGAASDEQKRMFEHMLALQATAFEAIRPGVTCSEVDRAVRDYYEKHDLQEYWKHHTGHAIGLRYHEGPFLDEGDETEIRVGMVFTVEPGLYVPELGGFRHSDTVAVTEEGIEILTYYPRGLESLTIPV
ncbi:MAG TPA: Xaa-Pro peptidase family protein [Anaerolineales bacterium]